MSEHEESPTQQGAEHGETYLNMLLPMLDGVPGLGTALNGIQGAYHLGAAGYDALTGDRDGAVAQGAQALTNVVGMTEGGEVIGAVDKVLGTAGALLKFNGVGGKDSKDIPQSTGDLAADAAVYEANHVLGPSGATATGNRRGEIGAGISTALGASLLGPLGPLGMLAAPLMNQLSGNVVGNLAGDLFDTPKAAATTGAGDPSVFQRQGRDAHVKDPVISLFADLF